VRPPALVERFLAAFHDADPGGTARAFAGVPLAAPGGAAGSPADGYTLLARALADAEPALPPGALLDLGCGCGLLLAQLRPLTGRALLGADLSAGELAAARHRLAGSTGVALHRARAQALPLRDGALAAVLSHMALMLMAEPEQVVAELARVLAPGGRLLALVPAAPPAGEPADALTAAWLAALGGRPRAARWQGLRFEGRRWRDPASLAALLAPGFEAPRCTPLHGALRLSPGQAWQHFIGLYDLHLLPDADWPAVQLDFLGRAAALRDDDGLLHLPLPRLLVDARRRGRAAETRR